MNDQIDDLMVTVKELEEALNETTHSSVVLDVKELKTESLLTEKTKQALARKATQQVVVQDGKAYMCIYLSLYTTEEALPGAEQRLADALNRLSEADLIHSCLAPPSRIQLAIQAMHLPTLAVFSFVLVPAERKEEAENIASCAHEEGAIPETAGSTEKLLAEGEFYAVIELSHSSYVFDKKAKSTKERLDDEIDLYLNVLPKGTEVRSVTQCTIVSLSIPFEVIFYHPLMKDYKQVRLHHTRNAVALNDHVEQFNLLDSVEYIRRKTIF